MSAGDGPDWWQQTVDALRDAYADNWRAAGETVDAAFVAELRTEAAEALRRALPLVLAEAERRIEAMRTDSHNLREWNAGLGLAVEIVRALTAEAGQHD